MVACGRHARALRRCQTPGVSAEATELLPVELIERRIYLIRGQKVMIDADLAELYGTSTKSLNLAVRRNRIRFPWDFMFQLSREEVDSLRSQTVTFKAARQVIVK